MTFLQIVSVFSKLPLFKFSNAILSIELLSLNQNKECLTLFESNKILFSASFIKYSDLSISIRFKKISSYGRERCFPILEYALILDKFF